MTAEKKFIANYVNPGNSEMDSIANRFTSKKLKKNDWLCGQGRCVRISFLCRKVASGPIIFQMM